jgi:hypothetical protein
LSNTDSILLPTEHVAKLAEFIGTGLGQLHLEKQAPEAIIIRANLYYLGDDHIRSAGIPHSTIEASGNVRGWFLSKL